MSIVAPSTRIASAFAVLHGPYGAVRRTAQQRGVCRQWLYREATATVALLQGTTQRHERDRLRQRLGQLQQRLADCEQRLAQAVVLDRDKQAEFAAVGQALGVSLPEIHALLAVLLPGSVPSVATLGRWTQAAGQQAGPLLAVLDEATRPRVRQAVLDEIYVSQPVLMVVEPESLCWVAGRRLDEAVTGAAWTQELGRLPALEQAARDGGNCLGRGIADANRQRSQCGKPAIADQLDHFHLLRAGGRLLGGAEKAVRRAFAAWEAAEAQRARCVRQGQSPAGCSSRVRACQARAERAFDTWSRWTQAWRDVQAALQPFTAEGELNNRRRAQATLAKALAQLPDVPFASCKRHLQRAEALTYLDEIERKIATLPAPAAVREAAVCQEGLRRRPEVLRGETASASALRGVLLACAVLVAQAGAVGQQAVAAVQAAVRSSWRASSLVECVNSVLRMQQARHRKMSQGLLDLKRLYWNSHVLRTGRRRGRSPYQGLGIAWPEGLRWWDVLKWTPQRLRAELSTWEKTA